MLEKNNTSNDENITIIVSNSTNSIFYTLPTQSTENILISKTLAMYKYHGTTEVDGSKLNIKNIKRCEID